MKEYDVKIKVKNIKFEGRYVYIETNHNLCKINKDEIYIIGIQTIKKRKVNKNIFTLRIIMKNGSKVSFTNILFESRQKLMGIFE